MRDVTPNDYIGNGDERQRKNVATDEVRDEKVNVAETLVLPELDTEREVIWWRGDYSEDYCPGNCDRQGNQPN